MAYLVETNLLLRLANSMDQDYDVAQYAIAQLHRLGESLRTSPQNLIEFWNVATRPAVVNGLGYTTTVAEVFAARFEEAFPVLPETTEIYPAWKAIVQEANVIGKQVHDARLAAICHVHTITHVLTFNVAHFNRFADCGPGLIVVSPRDIVS